MTFGKLDESAFQADVAEIKFKIKEYSDAGLSIFSTSSFQSQSLPLLHILSELSFKVPIYFTNTGFIHPETLSFADEVAARLKLDVIFLTPEVPKSRQITREGHLMYASDPDYCCYLNKVAPMEPVLRENDIWINGIRADQSSVRSEMGTEEPARFGCTRYHPMLRWDSRMIYYYRSIYSLPEHPLEAQGYASIGCEPCTSKAASNANARNSRWFGMNKTECGLNTVLVKG